MKFSVLFLRSDFNPQLVISSTLPGRNSATTLNLNATFEVGKKYAILFGYQWSNSCTFDTSQMTSAFECPINAGSSYYAKLYMGEAAVSTMKAVVQNNVTTYYCIIKLD